MESSEASAHTRARTHARTHAHAQATLVQFSWPRGGGATEGRSASSQWAESESLESRLACAAGAGVLLWGITGGLCRQCVLRRRFSRDCRKERRARSSSSGDEPSSSTSAISAKVTGCVLKRVSRERRERLLPWAGPLGTGRFWGNSSMEWWAGGT